MEAGPRRHDAGRGLRSRCSCLRTFTTQPSTLACSGRCFSTSSARHQYGAQRGVAILERGRSYGGHVVVIAQSAADADALTGPAGFACRSLTDNFAGVVSHRQTYRESRDWLAKLMGTRAVWQVTNQTAGHVTATLVAGALAGPPSSVFPLIPSARSLPERPSSTRRSQVSTHQHMSKRSNTLPISLSGSTQERPTACEWRYTTDR